jgi:hypothetical protein
LDHSPNNLVPALRGFLVAELVVCLIAHTVEDSMSGDEFPADVGEQRFYASVGMAITAWADIEDVLFAITFSILGSTRERTAIVFYRTPKAAFSIRQAMSLA